jgi:hypothetical protein
VQLILTPWFLTQLASLVFAVSRNIAVRDFAIVGKLAQTVLPGGAVTAPFKSCFPCLDTGGVIYDSFLLGATCNCSFGSDPISQFMFSLFLEHCSVRGFCGSRQARSNGLPGGAVTVPFKSSFPPWIRGRVIDDFFPSWCNL